MRNDKAEPRTSSGQTVVCEKCGLRFPILADHYLEHCFERVLAQREKSNAKEAETNASANAMRREYKLQNERWAASRKRFARALHHERSLNKRLRDALQELLDLARRRRDLREAFASFYSSLTVKYGHVDARSGEGWCPTSHEAEDRWRRLVAIFLQEEQERGEPERAGP